MKVTFLGADHEVTGSCTLVEACGKKILIDCGLEQGADIYENCDIPVKAAEIDAICVTHAHIDHSGKIPVLVNEGFNGPIYMTEATSKLCNIMLMDSGHIQEQEALWRNKRAKRSGGEEYKPIYTTKDVLATLPLFETTCYDKEIEIFEGIKILFTDDGHLLGSSNIRIDLTEKGINKSILFSGDIGNHNKPLLNNPKKAPTADYVVVESTYGDRLHPENPDYIGQLTSILERTLSRGGTVVVPAFAVGRTQEMLYYLRVIKEKGLVKCIPDFPVYVDSPLATSATTIYTTEVEGYYDEEARTLVNEGKNPIAFSNLNLVKTVDESKALNLSTEPKVIISASGMCEAGRIRHHLKHNLWRSECTIVLVGYQSDGTVGRKLLDGAEDVRLFGEVITVQAEIAKIEGNSSHADKNMLLDWLKDTEAKKVFVNHGEDEVTNIFAQTINDTFGWDASAPFSGEVWDLFSCECIEKQPVVPVVRRTTTSEVNKPESEGRKQARALNDSLVAAGRRLNAIIGKYNAAPNKETSKFISEIDKICRKYDR